MSTMIATTEELQLLTRGERRIYEMYRIEGRTRDEICVNLRIKKESFRIQWSRAMSKIKKYRNVMENPQRMIAKGIDVLKGIK